MSLSKNAYLKKLTAGMRMPSARVGKSLDGASPPSVFIGSWNYPKVYAGPMLAPRHGDIAEWDRPESWIPGGRSQEDIIGYRLNLVRGKRRLLVTDVDNSFATRLQELALASRSLESEARFLKEPRGASFSGYHAPYGPSAMMDRFELGNPKWDRNLEKAFYDWDWKAADAVCHLHRSGVPFSSIQKAFSAGTLGSKQRRRMVPTRWSITACDSAIGKSMLEKVRRYEPIGRPRVYEFSSLHNYYAVLLTPTAWQYEWMEAFLHVMGGEEVLFSDYERNPGKRGYSRVGGCYYSGKMGVLEAMEREKIQAGAVILREAYRGYVPLGVFNVRENVRNAMAGPYREFDELDTAVSYLDNKLSLGANRFMGQSDVFIDVAKNRQPTLWDF